VILGDSRRGQTYTWNASLDFERFREATIKTKGMNKHHYDCSSRARLNLNG